MRRGLRVEEDRGVGVARSRPRRSLGERVASCAAQERGAELPPERASSTRTRPDGLGPRLRVALAE